MKTENLIIEMEKYREVERVLSETLFLHKGDNPSAVAFLAYEISEARCAALTHSIVKLKAFHESNGE